MTCVVGAFASQELRGQLQKQRTIIQQQFEQLANLEEDEERRLQTVGNVTASAWATEKAALEATDGSMGAAMDTLWLCLCGALVMLLGDARRRRLFRDLPKIEA